MNQFAANGFSKMGSRQRANILGKSFPPLVFLKDRFLRVDLVYLFNDMLFWVQEI